MLEPGGVGGVACDGHVHVLLPHDGNAFRHAVGAVAVHLGAKSLRIGNPLDFLHFVGIGIVLGLYESEAVDTGDDLRGILSKTVQDDAQRFLADLVGLLRDTDSALCGCKGLMSCQEAEAVRVLLQKHFAQIAMAQAYLTGIGNGSGDTECLKALSDGGGGIRGLAAALLDSDGSAHRICPTCVLEADRLNLLHLLIYIQASVLGNLLCLFDRGDAIAVQYFRNFSNTSFI